MIGLLIDTATELGSIALYKDNNLLYSDIFSSGLNHLHTLHPAVDRMLKETGVSLIDIYYYGVDIGPGSFTGIRIGVTVARAFAQIENKYIFGATSLDIICQSVTSYKELICVALDGKKNRIYTAFYVFKNESPEKISDYSDIEPDELLIKIKKYKNKYNEILFLGSGQGNYLEVLKKAELKSVFTSEKYFYPEAKYIYYCMDKKNLSKDYEKIIPFYLRKSDAEEKVRYLTASSI